MNDWLRQPGAQELLAEMRYNQDNALAAVLGANTNDSGLVSAMRLLQGAEQVIEYITARIDEAHAKLKAAENRGEES